MKVRVRAASILPQASPRASFSAVFAVRADVPFAARCFAAVFLAGCSADGVAHTESIIAPQLARVAPYGITFYDRERAELGGCDAYHAFVSTDEHARHLFFHCWTRKTPMPLGTHRAALLRSQLMVHALHVPMDDDVPHLLAALPLFDTTVLVVVTSTCSMTTMRRAMTAYAESVPAGTPFAAGDCDALFGQLCSVQQVAFALQNVGASLQFVPIPEKAGAGSEEKGDDVREDYDSEGRPSHSLSLPCLHVGTQTLVLPPKDRHRWESLSSCSRGDTGQKPARPRSWCCPSCGRAAASPQAVGRRDSPTHWCPCCQACNVCADVAGVGRERVLVAPCPSPLPRHDVDLTILLSKLDARNFIIVLVALMCDRLVRTGVLCVFVLCSVVVVCQGLPAWCCFECVGAYDRSSYSARTWAFWQRSLKASSPCCTPSPPSAVSFRCASMCACQCLC